uniref:Uncharacterized protein n=1 Tax=Salix viminalis TaxID=40686 RepID=A0A6N2MUF4_SALVM
MMSFSGDRSATPVFPGSQNPDDSGFSRIGSSKSLASHESRTPRWRLLWRRKGRFFTVHRRLICILLTIRALTLRILIMSNPDDSSRSFSARFAVPSRIFEKGGIQEFQ